MTDQLSNNELSPDENTSLTTPNFLICQFCDSKTKLFENVNELKDHIYESHIDLVISTLNSTSLPSLNSTLTSTLDEAAHPPTVSVPSNSDETAPCSLKSMESFCNICKKEVCNKYFLKSKFFINFNS